MENSIYVTDHTYPENYGPKLDKPVFLEIRNRGFMIATEDEAVELAFTILTKYRGYVV